MILSPLPQLFEFSKTRSTNSITDKGPSLIATLRLLVICLCFVLSACSQLQTITQQPATEENTAAKEKTKTDYRDFDLSNDTLYDLMVAEIAAQRQQFNVTLINYIHQARATKDLAIIKRAINAAQYLKDVEAIREMALLWLEVEPDSIAVHQLLAFQYSLQQQFSEAIYHIDEILTLGGSTRVDNMALGSPSLPVEKKQELLNLYIGLYEKHPNVREIGHSIALMYRDMKDFDKALSLLDPILKEHEDFEPSVVLKTSILMEQGDIAVAAEYAEEQYDNFPNNHALGRMYASLLVDQKKLDEAEEVFRELIELYPTAPGLKLSHALVLLENNKQEESKTALEELLKEGLHPNESHFYLARIADSNDEKEKAIEHYYQVKESIHFEPALERASYLMSQLDRTDEALEKLQALREETPKLAEQLWLLEYKLLSTIGKDEEGLDTLNKAIEAFPTNENFLYARAMTFEQNNQLDKMEADLRKIMEGNPKHAVAINALGYTLADKTDRTQEALALITLALSLKPENPAILDSMGWVLYRLGQKEEALVFLSKAYNAYPDPEVAAHLGEVLYVFGKIDEAKIIWQQAMLKNPNHKVLNKTLERMVPEWFETLKPKNSEDAESEETAPNSEEQDTKNTTPSDV